MPGPFASEKRALGICDRCGFTFDLKELVYEVDDGRRTGLRVCGECLDPSHPQRDLGERPIYDPEALRDPRPDHMELDTSRALALPERDVQGVDAVARVGTVTVTVT